jgi:uncharacterized protein (TIGR03083 family)
MPNDKASAINELRDEYADFRATLKGLEPPQLEQPFLDGWSVKEIVAHVAGWENEMVAALERMARGERPTPEGVDYSNPDAWNARFAVDAAPISAPTVLARWDQTHQNFVRAAEALPAERYGEKEDGSLMTANRMLEGNGFGHYREHIAQIASWRTREGI